MDRESPGDNKLSRFQDIKADVFPYRKLKLDCVRRYTHKRTLKVFHIWNWVISTERCWGSSRLNEQNEGRPSSPVQDSWPSASFNISCAVTMCLYCFNTFSPALPWLCLWVYCPCTVSHPRPFQTRMTVFVCGKQKDKS